MDQHSVDSCSARDDARSEQHKVEELADSAGMQEGPSIAQIADSAASPVGLAVVQSAAVKRTAPLKSLAIKF